MVIFQLLGLAAVAGRPPDGPLARHRGVRAVLATLLHHANQHVGSDRLAACVWANPPTSAHARPLLWGDVGGLPWVAYQLRPVGRSASPGTDRCSTS